MPLEGSPDAWQLTERLTAAVNAPLPVLSEEQRRTHEWHVRESSHHHVQMRIVLEALGASLKLPMQDRRCIASLLEVHFDDPD
jgi:hypothetical protein